MALEWLEHQPREHVVFPEYYSLGSMLRAMARHQLRVCVCVWCAAVRCEWCGPV